LRRRLTAFIAYLLTRCHEIILLLLFKVFVWRTFSSEFWRIANNEAADAYASATSSSPPLEGAVPRGRSPRDEHRFLEELVTLRDSFKGNFLRLIVDSPDKRLSPAGHSLFRGLAESAHYLGLEVVRASEMSTQLKFDGQPTVFLISNDAYCSRRIDWETVHLYKSHAPENTFIGLTGSVDSRTPEDLRNQIKIKKDIWGVDFFFSFRAPEFTQAHSNFELFAENLTPIFSYEIGFNPLLYYPVQFDAPKFDYIFIGSINVDKSRKMRKWAGPIFRRSRGLVYGAGWSRDSIWPEMSANRILLSSGKVGINLHLEEQVKSSLELNERCYILCATGVPQLVDNPKLLETRFPASCVFSANDPEEYVEKFYYILKNPEEARYRADMASVHAFKRHTTLHRLSFLIDEIRSHFHF
jgi:hypothetical protein